MSFELKFQPWPPQKPCLRFAAVPWDAETLGLPIFELALLGGIPRERAEEGLDRWLAERRGEGRSLVYSRTRWEDLEVARRLGRAQFYPVESTVNVSVSLGRFEEPLGRAPGAVRLRVAEDRDLPTLKEIARTAFAADRYHQDPHIPAGRADERFARWIERALESGELVFSYEESGSGEILGFFHLRPSTPQAVDLSLAAIKRALRGSGLGPWMYQEVLRECRKRGFERAFTRMSVGNLDVVNLYARLGFSFAQSVLTWHWFGSAAGEEQDRCEEKASE
jgi:GNAT superfamily N-acetyltransferase